MKPVYLAGVALVMSAISSASNAQSLDCADKFVVGTTESKELFACLQAMQAAIQTLQSALVGLPDAQTVKAALIADPAAIQALRGERGEAAFVPAGAVVAFDGARYHRKADGELSRSGCPDGWVRFLEGNGRTIIGASPPKEDGYKLRAEGGSPTHVLTIAEMPRHNHANSGYSHLLQVNGVRTPGHDADTKNKYGPEPDIFVSKPLAAQGEGVPHNNMPPYIALYFCKKEG